MATFLMVRPLIMAAQYWYAQAQGQDPNPTGLAFFGDCITMDDVVGVICAVLLSLVTRTVMKGRNAGKKNSSKTVSVEKASSVTPATACPRLEALKAKRQNETLVRRNQAIHQAAQAANPKLADQLFRDMVESGIVPSLSTFHALIHGCAKRGDMQNAEKWFDKLTEDGKEPTVETHNMMIDCAAKANDPQAAESWLKRMHNSRIRPNHFSYTTLINAHAKVGRIEKARAWFEEMKEQGVRPNIVTYNSLITAYSQAGDAEGAEDILVEVVVSNCSPKVTTFTAIIGACKKKGDLERAESVMKRMEFAGVEPNVMTYTTLVDVCTKAGKPEVAEKWFNAMIERGIQPNTVSYNALFAACSADPERCHKAFQRMMASGIKPDVISYTSVAISFAHKGSWELVEKLHGDMKADGIPTNDYMMYALLTAYSKANPRQHGRARDAFQSAVEEGLKPNEHTLQALRRAVGPAACQRLWKRGAAPTRKPQRFATY